MHFVDYCLHPYPYYSLIALTMTSAIASSQDGALGFNWIPGLY